LAVRINKTNAVAVRDIFQRHVKLLDSGGAIGPMVSSSGICVRPNWPKVALSEEDLVRDFGSGTR
jgi:hypothetical protein